MSRQFDDPYFSIENGLAETRHVFLDGNNLHTRLCDGFHIGELGFGTGLNFLTTLDLWQRKKVSGRFYFTSFEAFPLNAHDMFKAFSAFTEIAHLAQPLLEQWQTGQKVIHLEHATLNVIVGDAQEHLPNWDQKADAWFLDGFSPAKNPELWSEPLLREVFHHSHAQATFATYSAAGYVRRSLEKAGFHVKRCKGFGKKRHMSIGHKPTNETTL